MYILYLKFILKQDNTYQIKKKEKYGRLMEYFVGFPMKKIKFLFHLHFFV